MLGIRRILVYAWILILVAIAEGIDGVIDFLEEGLTLGVFVDGLIILLVFGGCTYILYSAAVDLRRSRASIRELQLENEEFRRRNPAALNLMWEAIQNQFKQWNLSSTESQIAEHLIRGYSSKQIAAMLDKSERTVRNQARAVYEKSGMTGRNDLAAFFIQEVIGERDD